MLDCRNFDTENSLPRFPAFQIQKQNTAQNYFLFIKLFQAVRLLLITCNNSERKILQIVQIRHFESQGYTLINFFIFRTFKQSHCLYGLMGLLVREESEKNLGCRGLQDFKGQERGSVAISSLFHCFTFAGI